MLRGNSTYTYDGNWKLQAENGATATTSQLVHWNYAATMRAAAPTARSTRQGGGRQRLDASSAGGVYRFENGHILLWTNWSEPRGCARSIARAPE